MASAGKTPLRHLKLIDFESVVKFAPLSLFLRIQYHSHSQTCICCTVNFGTNREIFRDEQYD